VSGARWPLVSVRLALAFLGFSAVVTEIATLVARGVFVPANFFSYFTIESNVLAVVLLDWVLSGRSAAVPYRRALLWLAVPAAYLVHSLVRGRVVGWYPYPFLDPATAGYAGVALTSAVVAVVLAAVTWVVARAPGWVPGTRS
jgi:hypothetical protein